MSEQPSLFPDPSEAQAVDKAAPKTEKSLTGRPSVLTQAVQENIVKALRAGAYLDTAASYAGVTRQSVNNWIRRGRAERTRLETSPKSRLRAAEEPFVIFFDAIEKALADSELFHIDNIRKASKENWQASAWMLERKSPERWGRRSQVALTGANDGPVQVASSNTIKLDGLELADLLALDAIAAKAEALAAGQAVTAPGAKAPAVSAPAVEDADPDD